MFRVYREHRLGTLRASINDCMDAINHQRQGDRGECKYRIEYDERDGYAGYTVYRRHIVGDYRCVDWAEAHRRAACSGRTDSPGVTYHIEVV